MISKFGKYIPFIFLTTVLLVLFDGLLSFHQVNEIQGDYQNILLAYQHVETSFHIAINHSQSISIKREKTYFYTNVFRMYMIIVLTALLNITFLMFTYIVIMKELKQRTILEQKKNDFISLASHELKTPITTMSIFTEILKNKLPTSDRKINHLLSRMENQVNEMKSLINDLLDITRIQLGKLELQKEYFDIIVVMHNTIEDIQATTTKHAIFFKGKGTLIVYADKQRIWQVLTNLLNNAIKYSPQGGKIFVRLEEKTHSVLISVKDYGIGIHKNVQPNIFGRYFREEEETQKQFDGLGLGLYLTQQIIYLHRGRIWVKSAPQKGSTFYFTLPLAQKKYN